jgi:hypothetical protein
MAFRRRLANLADTFLKQHLAQQNAEYENTLIEHRQQQAQAQAAKQAMASRLLDQLSSNPQLAERLKGQNIGGIPADLYIPTSGQAYSAASKPISDAKSLGDLPGVGDIPAMFNAQPGHEAVEPGPTEVDPVTGLNKPRESKINLLMEQRAQKEAALKAASSPVDRTFINPQGIKTTKSVNPWADLGNEYQQELTPEQTISRDNQITKGEAGPKASAAALTKGAEESASAPFHPDYFYNENDEATPVINSAKGPKVGAPIGKLTKTAPGGPGQRLPVSAVDRVTGMNTAEVEGVKILTALKQSGLDRVNDPTDPRWQKFLAGTLKMSSSDLTSSDIQQRTAYVQAAILKSLMAGRPSKWIADIYMQHIPSGDMTGSKLKQVVTNVLQQTGEQRKEMETLYGRPLGPASGMTFDQYNTSNPPDTSMDDPLSTGRSILQQRRSMGVPH